MTKAELLLLTASCGLLATVLNAAVREPVGTFVLQGIDKQNVSDSSIKKSDGLSIRVSWAAIDKQNSMDWRWLDLQIARAKKFNKPYMIRVMAGNNSPEWIPGEWFKGAPLPWNETAQAKLSQFVTLLGARYNSDPFLVLVHLSSTANYKSAEMHLADGLTRRRDYTLAKLYGAWESAIEDYGRAFPDAALSLNASIEPNNKGELTSLVVGKCKETLGERATFQHNSLKASTSETAGHHALIRSLGADGWRIGFQMVSPSSNRDRFGGSFEQAIAKGERAGAQYYEVYQTDLQ